MLKQNTKIIIFALSFLFIFLVASSVSAVSTDFYWELPTKLSRGAGCYPQALKTNGKVVAIWQENVSSGENGNAWLSLNSYGGDEIVKRDRIIGPLPYSGEAPIMFSVTSNSEKMLVAAVTAAHTITTYISQDAGRSFSEPVNIEMEEAAVAPRVFSLSGGAWIMFTTKQQTFTRATSTSSSEYQALSIFYSYSSDGKTWSAFAPFVGGQIGLDPNFLPSSCSINNTDIAVFQSLRTGARPSYQLYSTISKDKGLTWSEPKLITEFTDPIQRTVTDFGLFNNERAHLAVIAGKIWMTWERRFQSGREQVYLCQLDTNGNVIVDTVSRISLGQGNCSEPRIFETDDQPSICWFDDRRGTNRVYASFNNRGMWQELDLSGKLRGGEGTFGRAVYFNDSLYSFWQTGSGSSSSVIGMIPDTTVKKPSVYAQDFTPNKATRKSKATLSWSVPDDSSGIAGFAWSWSQDPNVTPDKTRISLVTQTRASFEADNDGPWYFSLCAQDYAGNWSEPNRAVFVRDLTPPSNPIFNIPESSEDGFLASNNPTISWQASPEDDVAGYTWSLEYLGSLDRLPARKRPIEETNKIEDTTKTDNTDLTENIMLQSDEAEESFESEILEEEVQNKYSLQANTDYELTLWEKKAKSNPLPVIRTSKQVVSFSNIDDGYWMFSVAAIDNVGNVGETVKMILRTDKFIPYTIVNDITVKKDVFGTMELTVLGRGYSDDGAITKFVIDDDGKEPYIREYNIEENSYNILSDRIIKIANIKDLEQGRYRIGLFHPVRGWYFTSPRFVVDVTGTVKYGDRGEAWKPSWSFVPSSKSIVDFEKLFIFIALIIPALGIILLSRQVAKLALEMKAAKVEAIALLEGKPMLNIDKKNAVKSVVRKGRGLSAKFMLAISLLVIFVVVLVSVPLATQMIDSQSSILARGLEQRAKVLLESVVQGGKSYLPARNVLELSLLPNQSSGVEEAKYLTITGYGTGNSSSPDSVWASNDVDISKKIDTTELNAGVSVLTDELSSKIDFMREEIDKKAQLEVGSITEAISQIQNEGQVLASRLDDESQAKLNQLSATARDLEKTLSERLSDISNSSVSSVPIFEPENLKMTPEEYVFYKPILFRQGRETNYYRGLVRLCVSTESIVAEVSDARNSLLRSISIVAALALAVGVLGSVILAGIITKPLLKVIAGVQVIKDTPDKKDLAEFNIKVKSKDELQVLAATINEMTSGLVHAAAEAEMLTVGKEVQKMFIPLRTNSIGEKLTTGEENLATHSFYGYYEGAKGVSGDYFDYRSLDGRFFAFIKCDVSGKGVPAALIMVGVATIFSTEFQYWTYKQNGIHLDKLTYKINDFIERRGFKGRFAAFLMGVYDSKTGTAYICHAGDKLVHVWKENEGHLVTHSLPEAPTAGTFSNDLVEMTAPYKQAIIKLDVGDSLLLYTDGFEEASRAQRGRDFKQLFEMVPITDKDGNVSEHKELLVEQLGEERINQACEAIMKKEVYVLRKENDPLGNDVVYEFDFSKCDAGPEVMVLGLAAIEKVFRMIPDPTATMDDKILVDAKIDELLKKCWKQYSLFCSNTMPHSDPNKQEYLYYKGLKEDDQYDDLTMMLIKRNS